MKLIYFAITMLCGTADAAAPAEVMAEAFYANDILEHEYKVTKEAGKYFLSFTGEGQTRKEEITF